MSSEGKRRKVKTTIYIDEELWRKLQHYVIEAYGSARKTSEFVEECIRECLEKRQA